MTHPHLIPPPPPGHAMRAPSAAPTGAPAAPVVAAPVAPQAPNPFAGMGSVGLPGVQNYFRDGTYLISLNALRRIVSQNPETRGHQMLVADVTILETLVDLGNSNKPGERVAQVINLNKNPETSLSNAKGIITASLGMTPQEVFAYDRRDLDPTDEFTWAQTAWDASAGAGDALSGTKCLVTANTIKTRAGNPFTKCIWSAVQASAPADTGGAAAAQ